MEKLQNGQDAEDLSMKQLFESKMLPPWWEQITFRGMLVSMMLGIMFCVIVSGGFNSHGNAFLNHSTRKTAFDVVINHRGIDTKESVASLIYYYLKNKDKELEVFFDKNSIEVGDSIVESIKHAIRTASVHVVILSPNYAQSEWCLEELHLILESGAPIIPVFWEIKPSVVRMEDEDGVYAKTFQMHKQNGKFKTRELMKWKNALRRVSDIKGYIYKGDQGEMLENIAMYVTKYIDMAKSQAKLSKARPKMRTSQVVGDSK